MRGNIVVQGENYFLRSVNNTDIDKIIELRTNLTRSVFLNKITIEKNKQEEWLECYYNRENDYYFAIVNNRTSLIEGFISVYDISIGDKSGEIGRWIIDEASNSALESIFLIYKFSFEVLNLNYTYCRTLSDNKKVVSLHDSYGAKRSGELIDEFLIGDEKKNAIKHELYLKDWGFVSSKLNKYINFLSKRMG